MKDFETEGWTLFKPLKTGVKIRKERSPDQLLEDRFWCCLYRLARRPCLCRPLGRSGPALRPRQWRAGGAYSIRDARRLVARLWSINGRSHLIIGHVPEERVVGLAQMIEKQA